MKLEESDLLPGEHLIKSKGCNAVISISEYGLSKFAADSHMWAVGMKGQEAIGGHMHLTNYRLLFKSHKLNRVRGKASIFLPVISEIKNTSRLLVRQMTVCTESTDFRFVVWGVPGFIESIDQARAELTATDYSELGDLVTENFDRCGDGLETFGGLEAFNKALLAGKDVADMVKIATNPWQAAGVMLTGELLNRIVKDPINQKMTGQRSEPRPQLIS